MCTAIIHYIRAFFVLFILAECCEISCATSRFQAAIFAPDDCGGALYRDYHKSVDYSFSEASTIYPDISVDYVMYNSCDITSMVEKMSKCFSNRSLTAVLEHGNYYICKIYHKFTNKIVPMISSSCSSGKGFARTSPSGTSNANALMSFLKYFKWGRLLILTDNKEPMLGLCRESVIRLAQEGFKIVIKELDNSLIRNKENVKHILEEMDTGTKGRKTYLFSSNHSIGGSMLFTLCTTGCPVRNMLSKFQGFSPGDALKYTGCYESRSREMTCLTFAARQANFIVQPMHFAVLWLEHAHWR
jgi:hypothetical protein